ncbi:MAG: excisionase family DNA-binding protein [Chloroflexia bacterium]|nr:excisionase family DNA-binding protein [Chloroflexia bacterium]
MADSTVQTVPASGDVYTMAEAARLKGVSYHTVSRAVRRGKLPAQRLGRMALINAEDLRDWRPMRERAPHKYRRREPNPDAAPALLDLSSGERVDLASALSTMYEMVHDAAAESPLPEYLALFADRFAAVTGLRRTAVWGFAEATGRASRLASFGPPFSMLPAELPITGSPALERMLSATEATVVADAGDAFGVSKDDLLNVGPLFVVPLRVGSRSLGMVVGDANGGSFKLSPNQQVLAQGLAHQAALAIERAWLLGGDPRSAGNAAVILERLPVAVVVTDRDGAPIFANPAARDLLGLPAGSLDARNEAWPTLGRMTNSAGDDEPLTFARPDGGEIALLVDVRPASSGAEEPIGSVAVLRRAGANGAGREARTTEPAHR